MILFKYQGAGNDFLMADGRGGKTVPDADAARSLCDRHYGLGADGLIVLEDCPGHDFGMKFFNPDGSGGMMCGNGGRCAVAFAADLGIGGFSFMGPDGPHMGEILSSDGRSRTVRLTMKDVEGYKSLGDGLFIDTGTRHFVVPVVGIAEADVTGEGRRLRHDARFAPAGTNVDFIEWKEDVLYVRTYEKGVEDETLACGTGIVASVLAAFIMGGRVPGRHETAVQARRDRLSVGFTASPAPTGLSFRDITLTGSAVYVAKIEI